MSPNTELSQERQDLLESLATHRYFLRQTTDGLDEQQVRLTPTVSTLSLGGLIKHVAGIEAMWAQFIVEGPGEQDDDADGAAYDEEAIAAHLAGFSLADDESLASVLAAYDEVAARTDELVRTVDLDHAWPLPAAPWFEPGATRSARRVFVHLVAETAQHAGHADIIRESIDGKKSMG